LTIWREKVGMGHCLCRIPLCEGEQVDRNGKLLFITRKICFFFAFFWAFFSQQISARTRYRLYLTINRNQHYWTINHPSAKHSHSTKLWYHSNISTSQSTIRKMKNSHPVNYTNNYACWHVITTKFVMVTHATVMSSYISYQTSIWQKGVDNYGWIQPTWNKKEIKTKVAPFL